MPSSSMGSIALWYVKIGWPVLPLLPRQKLPNGMLCRHGVYGASTNPEQIAAWWRACPTGNVGLAAGHSWFVLDVDPRNGGGDTLYDLEQSYGSLPDTVVQLTPSGGEHRLFRCDRNFRVRKKIGAGIDCKGHGGYIVAAPSIHPNGGEYIWESSSEPTDISVAAPPHWLLRLVTVSDKEVRAARTVATVQDSFLAVAFAASGWLRSQSGNVLQVVCPWASSHSPGPKQNDGTVLLAPTIDHPLGKFYCHHKHADGRHTWDILKILPDVGIIAAASRFPDLARLAIDSLSTPVWRPKI